MLFQVPVWAEHARRIPKERSEAYSAVLQTAAPALAECVRRARTLQIRELAIELVTLTFDDIPVPEIRARDE